MQPLPEILGTEQAEDADNGPETPPVLSLQHVDSAVLIRENSPHFHPSLQPTTFRVGNHADPGDNRTPPDGNADDTVRPCLLLEHQDSVDLPRQNPPHLNPSLRPPAFQGKGVVQASAQAPDGLAMQVGRPCNSDGSEPDPSASLTVEDSPSLHHVDSTTILRAHRSNHPPKKRESLLQPLTFRVGEEVPSPKASEQENGIDSSDGEAQGNEDEDQEQHFRHVDSVEIIRRHPPQPRPSPLGPPTFQVGSRNDTGDGDGEESKPTDAVDASASRSEGEANAMDKDRLAGDACKGLDADGAAGASGAAAMSKNQMKKMLKKQKVAEAKAKKKQQEREAKAAELAKRKAETDAKLAAMTLEEAEAFREERRAIRVQRQAANTEKKEKMKAAMESGQRVAVDLDFQDKMVHSEIRSLCQQLSYCYSANTKAPRPFCLHFTSLNGKLKETLQHQASGHGNWTIKESPEPMTEVFKDCMGDLVYLTADSPNVLSDLDPSKVYVIGGIVDRNRHKGICYEKASDLGIETAALPIGPFLQLKTSKVFTVNHVLEIMLHYAESKDWKEAFHKVVPERKRAPDGEDGPEAKKQRKDAE